MSAGGGILRQILSLARPVQSDQGFTVVVYANTNSYHSWSGDTLYYGVKEGSLGEASMKRHILAAAFDQGNSPTTGVVNLVRADQQISNWFHIHRALRGIIQAMSELGGKPFHRCRPCPGGNILFISPNRFPEKSLPENCSPVVAIRTPASENP